MKLPPRATLISQATPQETRREKAYRFAQHLSGAFEPPKGAGLWERVGAAIGRGSFGQISGLAESLLRPPETAQDFGAEAAGTGPNLLNRLYLRPAQQAAETLGGLNKEALTVRGTVPPQLGYAPILGPIMAGSLRRAKEGDIAGALIEPATMALTAKVAPEVASDLGRIAGEGLGRFGEMAGGRLRASQATKATESAIRAAGTRGAAEAESMASATQRGYMNEAARIYQDLQKQPQKGPVRLPQNMANAAEATRQVAGRIQSMRDEVVARQADNPLAIVAGNDIGRAVLDSITDNDVKNFPERLTPIVREANRYFEKTYTLQEALRLSEDLNTQARALYEAKPESAAAITRTKAAKRAIDASADSVRGLIADKLTSVGENGAEFRQLGRDYGAMRDIHEAFRDATARSVGAEAGKPSYSPMSLVGRSIARHPLLAGGILGASEYLHEPGLLAALPSIEAIRTFMERRGLPESQINQAMKLFGKAGGKAPALGSAPPRRRAPMRGPLAPPE